MTKHESAKVCDRTWKNFFFYYVNPQLTLRGNPIVKNMTPVNILLGWVNSHMCYWLCSHYVFKDFEIFWKTHQEFCKNVYPFTITGLWAPYRLSQKIQGVSCILWEIQVSYRGSWWVSFSESTETRNLEKYAVKKSCIEHYVYA